MRYHEAISWNEYDLGRVTDFPHSIKLIPGATGVRQATRKHLHMKRNAEIIKQKTQPLNMGVYQKCNFSDWPIRRAESN